jgi:hypothetical protein
VGQGFNRTLPLSDSLAHTLHAEASVSNENFSWIVGFPGSRSQRYNRTFLLYKVDKQGHLVDTLLFAKNRLSSLYSREFPVFLFLTGDTLLQAVLHANDSEGRAIYILGIDPNSMELRWQRIYRSDLPRDFIGSSITSACQIRNDSLALLFANYNSGGGVVSILGDSGNVARQFVVGNASPMSFQEMSFQRGAFWFIGFRGSSDVANHPCVMEVDLEGREQFFYQFDYSGRIGLYGSLIVPDRSNFGFLVTRLKKKIYALTGEPFDAGQGLLVEYDGRNRLEKRYEVDSLSFYFVQEYAARGLNEDAFLAGGDRTFVENAAFTTDFGYLAKTRLGQGELWSRRYRYVREPGRDTTFTLLRFKYVEGLPDGGALAVGYFLKNYEKQNMPVKTGQGWVIRVDSFGCVVPGCQSPVTSLAKEQAAGRLLVAPNPVQDICYAHWLSNTAEEAQFSLNDVQGRTLRSWTNRVPELTLAIPMKSLPAGIYYLNVQLEGKQVAGQKIVKTN